MLVRKHQRPVRSRTTFVPASRVVHRSPLEHRIVELQQSAGNAAVTRLLQRQPPTGDVAAPSVEQRLKEAIGKAKPAFIAEQIKLVYKAQPDGGVDAWVQGLRAVLGVGDVTAPDKKDKKALSQWNRLTAVLKSGTNTGLLAMLKAQAPDIAAEPVTKAARAQFDADAFMTLADVTDVVWGSTLGNGSITKMPAAVVYHAREHWKALNARLADVRSTWATEKTDLTVAAATGPLTDKQVTPEMRDAAKAAVRVTPTWIATPAEVTAFTNTVANALAAKGPAVQNQVRAHGVGLLAMAETDIIKTDMAGVPGVDKLTTAGWLNQGRNHYQSFLTEPLWVYFNNRVADINFLGANPSKKSGMHVELEPMLRAVEKSMVTRQGTAKGVADLGVSKMYGLRFAISGPPEHNKARAFDLSPAWKNPMVKEQYLTMASVLSGDWLHKVTAQIAPPKRTAILAKIRPNVDEQQSLRAQLKAGTGDKAAIEARLVTLEAELKAVYAEKDVTDYVDQTLAAKVKLEAAKAKIAAAWTELTKDDADAATIKKAVQKKVDDALAVQTKAVADSKAALDAIATQKKGLKAETDKPKISELDKQATQQKEALKEANDLVSRLGKLKAFLLTREAATMLSGDAKRESQPSMGQLAAHGLIDMPDWFVGAFIENGWTWGAVGWGEQSGRDSMHFEYLGSLGGLRS